MIKLIKYLNLFFLFLIAPLIGFYYGFSQVDPVDAFSNMTAANIPANDMVTKTDNINEELWATHMSSKKSLLEVQNMLDSASKNSKEYEEQKREIEKLTSSSKQQATKSDIVLEQVLSHLLGEPISIHQGENSTIKIYTLNEAGYRGYMAKIRPHTSTALKLVLADDQVVSDGETPSEAAQRTGAILAVNGGGYWKTKEGKKAPLGITVVDGKIVTFYDEPKLSFVGFDTNGHLVGGKYTSREEVEKDHILQGSSFVPTLLQDGKKTAIPSDWANTKHPRTIVGNFSNGELLFIVIDGRRTGWSTGVTLEEVQDKLLSFKVKDAFNLDGGGSSAFYYNGKVLNKPSDGKERKVTSNLVIMP